MSLLKDAGVDLTTPAPIDFALKEFDKTLTEPVELALEPGQTVTFTYKVIVKDGGFFTPAEAEARAKAFNK